MSATDRFKRRKLDHGHNASRRQTPSRASTPRAGQEEDALAQDRDWYGGEENGNFVLGDDSHNPFGADNSWNERERESALAEKKNSQRMNAKQFQKQKDIDAWETNRMLTSGVAQKRDHFNNDFYDDNETTRAHVFVHDIKPPFLDGKTVFTKQLEPVSAVLDPQSDMAVASRKGSRIVKEKRQQKERQKQAQEATTVAGTALGRIMGVKEEDTDSALPLAGEDEHTKKTGFAEHLKQSQGASDFSKSKTLREQRQFLPAFAVREELLRVIRDNQVTIVVGQTGSGKTTQLTQFLYEDGYGKTGLIGCTQPRRVAAMSVAKRVSEEMEVKLGSTVGYAIRFEDCTSKDTVIKYMTDGVLLRECLTESDLDKYSCIIMDEAHERALNTDILLGLFKKVLARRRDLRLIVTSATMNAKRFSDFFYGAPEFTIPGRTFPVDVQYSKAPCEDYVNAAVQQAMAIHVSQGPGDILIFMTGQEDITVTCELLEERLKMLVEPQELLILPIFSQMPADLQARIFERAAPGVRKAIVATNIAETSLTVDGIMYVVDCGFSKLKVYNPRMGMDALQITPISQANASQRAGRAGRTGPGKAYHLFTERAFKEEMYIQTIPEIHRTNLANTVLLLKSLNVEDLLTFDFMDSPPQDAITTALFDLWAFGALDNLGRLTALGRKMSTFPIEPALSKMLLVSAQPDYQCTSEILTIISMLSVPNVFYRPKERIKESDAAREKFFVQDSDHLTLLNVYNQWKANNRSEGWCVKHFLHAKSLRRASEIRAQLADIVDTQLDNRRTMDSNGTKADCEVKKPTSELSTGLDWDLLRRVVAGSYYHQAAQARGIGEYSNLRTHVPVKLHSTSALYGSGMLPQHVVYHELVSTGSEFMNCVTAVEPRWLVEDGGMFYSLREKTVAAKNGRAGTEMVVEEVEFSKKGELERQMALDREQQKQEQEREKEREEEEQQKRRNANEANIGMASFKKKKAKPTVIRSTDEDEDEVVVKKPIVSRHHHRR